MADHPYLPLWTDAYLADTVHLSCLESGAYLHLLMCAWRTPDCALPDDDKKLARMAKCTPREWNKVRDAVMAFWNFDEATATWTQKRLLKERNHVHANLMQRAHAGRASALKRWGTGVTGDTQPLQRDGNGDDATHTHTHNTESSLRSDSDAPAPNGTDPSEMDIDAILYARGKALLGQNAGGQITRLKRKLGTYQALGVIEQAKRKESPAEYVAGAIHRRPDKERDVDLDEIGRRVEARLRTGHV